MRTITHSIEQNIAQNGLDIVWNDPSNVDAMGRIMTRPDAGIIPARAAFIGALEIVA